MLETNPLKRLSVMITNKKKTFLFILPVFLSLIFSISKLKAQNTTILNCNLIVVYQGENVKALYAPNAVVPSNTPINVLFTINLADTSGVNDTITDVNKINIKLYSSSGLLMEKSFNYNQKIENNGDNNYFTQTYYTMMFGLGNMILSDIKKIEARLEYNNDQPSEVCISTKQ